MRELVRRLISVFIFIGLFYAAIINSIAYTRLPAQIVQAVTEINLIGGLFVATAALFGVLWFASNFDKVVDVCLGGIYRLVTRVI